MAINDWTNPLSRNFDAVHHSIVTDGNLLQWSPIFTSYKVNEVEDHTTVICREQ